MPTDTIKQRDESVTLSDERVITVRRLKWKDLRKLMRGIAAAAGSVFGAVRDGAPMDETLIARIPALISESDDLVQQLALGSTDLTTAELDEMPGADALKIISAAVRINFDDELKNSFAGIKEGAAALLPAKKTG